MTSDETPASQTVLDVLNKTADYFKQKGIANARLDAQILLAHCLGMKRLDLYLNFDRPLAEGELARCREIVKRRGRREPLQHILGTWPFRELQLKVDKRALIPRPETEVLVDLVLKAWPLEKPGVAVDLGLGSGAIALSLMRERRNLQVYGTEVSPEALDLCRENAALSDLAADGFFLGSLFDPLPADLRFDLIVSNPPYIGRREIAGLQPEVRDWDPALALVGGEEGWELPFEIMARARQRLRPGGHVFLEVAPGQIPILMQQAEAQNWVFCGFSKDWSDNPRFIHLTL